MFYFQVCQGAKNHYFFPFYFFFSKQGVTWYVHGCLAKKQHETQPSFLGPCCEIDMIASQNGKGNDLFPSFEYDVRHYSPTHAITDFMLLFHCVRRIL